MRKPDRKRPSDARKRINVYSYYGTSRSTAAAESENDSRKTEKSSFGHFLRALRHISFGRLVVVVAFLVIFGVLLYANSSPIIRIDSDDLTARTAATYRDETAKIISSSILNHTKLTFDYNGTEEKLKQRFPEIEDARITFDVFGRRPVVQLALYPPAFRVDSSGSVWVVDSRGVAMGKQEDMGKDLADLPLIRDEIGLGDKMGTSLLSQREVAFLRTILDILDKESLSVSGIFIPQTPKELDIQLTGEEFRYRLSTEEKASEQAGALLATRDTLKTRNETPAEYVDLRTGEKVFWK